MADTGSDRREFLKAAARAGVVVPPAMAFLLSTTMTSDAIASSHNCNSGNGNGPEIGDDGQECDPGNSGNNNNDNGRENP